MDIEKLIEQYRQAADKWEKRHPITGTFDLRVQDALRDAATALSTLQAENEKLRGYINDLETQHRTEMCENGYDCVELGKLRAELEQVKAELNAAKSPEVLEAVDELMEFARTRMSTADWLYYVDVLGEWRGQKEG